MAHMFHKLVNINPTELFVYMDDILIATKNNLNCHWQIVDDVLELLTKESYFLPPSNVFLNKHILSTWV